MGELGQERNWTQSASLKHLGADVAGAVQTVSPGIKLSDPSGARHKSLAASQQRQPSLTVYGKPQFEREGFGVVVVRSERTERRVSIGDVAAAAGVSQATAARALAGRGYVSTDTQHKVAIEAKRLGYLRNQAARSLRTRRSMTIGLLVADVDDPFFATLAKHIEAASVRAGYRVLLCSSNDDPQSEADQLQALAEYGVDGLIVTPGQENIEILSRLIRAGTAVVQVDRRVAGLDADAVVLDNEAGASLAVEHLLSAGHRRIAMATGPLHIDTARDRLHGYEKALGSHGIEVDPALVHVGSFQRGGQEALVRQILRARPAATAIIAANSIIAESVWVAFSRSHLGAVRDVALVAFDDVPWMRMVDPAVTTIAQPWESMALESVKLLVSRLDGQDADTQARTIVMQPSLISRESVTAR